MGTSMNARAPKLRPLLPPTSSDLIRTFAWVQDHLQRVVLVPWVPERIISLCPSQTETLADLGLKDRLVGITRYCIHPDDQLSSIARVGGTKRVDFGLIQSLKPDLIVAEKEENTREMVEELLKIAPVYVTEVVDRASALRMITDLGDLTGRLPRARELVAEIEEEWGRLHRFPRPLRAAYLIWRKPWMGVGAGTYIGSLMREVGLTNVLECTSNRYPEVSESELQAADPELVLLSSEPYPFAEKHIAELQAFLPRARIVLVDGEAWSWYGSRMRKLPAEILALASRL